MPFPYHKTHEGARDGDGRKHTDQNADGQRKRENLHDPLTKTKQNKTHE